MDTTSASHATLILIRGLPGSGKSYLAAELGKTLGQEVVQLDPDATDYNSQAYAEHVARQQAAGVDPTLHAYRYLRQQAFEAVAARKIVIWNQPFTNLPIFEKMVTKLRAHAAENDVSLDMLVVEVQIDQAQAIARVAKRKQKGGHGPSNKTFARFIDDYSTAATLGYPTISVRGNDDVSITAAKVIEQLSTVRAAQ